MDILLYSCDDGDEDDEYTNTNFSLSSWQPSPLVRLSTSHTFTLSYRNLYLLIGFVLSHQMDLHHCHSHSSLPNLRRSASMGSRGRPGYQYHVALVCLDCAVHVPLHAAAVLFWYGLQLSQ